MSLHEIGRPGHQRVFFQPGDPRADPRAPDSDQPATGVLRNIKKKYDSAALQSACVPGKRISKAAMRGLGIHLDKRKQEQGSLAAFLCGGREKTKKKRKKVVGCIK